MKILRSPERLTLVVVFSLFLAYPNRAASPDQKDQTPYGTLVGSVVDSRAGRAVADARVAFSLDRTNQHLKTDEKASESVLTDREGHFRLRTMTPGEYSLVVRKAGYLTSPFYTVNLQAGKIGSLTVRLDPLGRVSGRVIDEKGDAVKGARVTPLIGRLGPHPALARMINEGGMERLLSTSGSQGEFELFWPTDETELALFAEASGYAPKRVEVNRSPSEMDATAILIRLSVGRAAHGRVLGDGNSPLVGATVKGVRLGPRIDGLGVLEKPMFSLTSENGAFILRGLVAGTYSLTFSHPTRASLVIPKIEIEDTDKKLPDIILPSQAKITGRITDAAGVSLSGAKIVARSDDVRIEMTSDQDGRFTVAEFSAGASVVLWAVAPGYVATNKTVDAPQNSVLLPLRRLGGVRGHVQDAESASSLREFRVWLLGGSEEKRFRSDDGSFEWGDLSPGRVKLAAQAPGYQTTTLDAEIRSAEFTDVVVFSLRKGVEFSGHVVDSETGEGLSDIRVTFKKATDDSDGGFIVSKTTGQSTDVNGDFKFDGVPSEKITIMTWSPLYANEEATADAAETTSIEIRLHRGAVLSGRVLARDSTAPVAGARVSLLSQANGTARGIATDSAGSFLFNHLSAGNYRLTAEASFGQSVPQNFTIVGNEIADNVVLTVSDGATVRGKATGTLPTEQKTVNLMATGPSGFSSFTSTDFEGNYKIAGVPVGVIHLLVSTSSSRSISMTVPVPAGVQEFTFDIDLPQNSRLHGRVTQGGKAIPFTDVIAIPAEAQMIRGNSRTDEEGTYEIGGLSDGDYTIRVPGAPTRSVHISGDTLVDIELSGVGD
jgi:protocatechuate 3,4-dioxygenase beta subunit